MSLFVFCEPWTVLTALLTILFRGWRLWRSARLLEFSVPGMPVAFWIASFVEALCWLLSWCTRRVWWAGRQWRVGFRGRFEPIEIDE
jgi:hypothetical protein